MKVVLDHRLIMGVAIFGWIGYEMSIKGLRRSPSRLCRAWPWPARALRREMGEQYAGGLSSNGSDGVGIQCWAPIADYTLLHRCNVSTNSGRITHS